MRRTIRAAAALGAALSVFASGCSAGPSVDDLLGSVAKGPFDEHGLAKGKPFEGTHIRLLSCCKTTAQFAALQKKTDKEFTRKTGITVEWGNIPYESYLQKIVAETAVGGGTYDLVVWPDSYGASAKIGLQPLGEVMRRAGRSIDEFPRPFQQAARAGAKDAVYGLPFRGFSFNNFYRKSVYDRLGMKPATSWDGFERQLRRLDGEGGRDAFAGQFGRGGGQNLYTWFSMLWSAGADILGENGEPAFDNPTGIEATKKYVSLLRDGYSPDASVNWTETEATQAFEQNHVNSVFTWAWQLDDFTDPEKVQPEVANDIGVAPLPGWEGRPAVSYGYTWLMGILNTSEHQGAAWEYLKWLTDAGTERDVALDKSDPATATSVMVHTRNMRDPELNEANHDLPRLQEKALRHARTVPMTIDWPQIQDVLEVSVNEMAHGADVESTLDDAARQIRELTDR